MAAIQNDLIETHINGEDSQRWVVRADDCPALRQRHISHVGASDAAVPYKVVRMNLSGAYLHGSIGGEGRMLIDGRWRRHTPGMASLAPKHVVHAFHAIPSQRWQFCWVRYTPDSPRSMINIMSPIMASFDCRPLRHAIMGLFAEMAAGRDAANCVLWVDLIERYVDHFAEPWRREERLLPVWNAVRKDLSRDWTLDELAVMAGVSNEHLRRLCLHSLGRSPMKHLANLRIEHAAHKLATTNDNIDEIAAQVGYGSAFAFSNVFKKMTGLRPSHFRARHRSRRQ